MEDMVLLDTMTNKSKEISLIVILSGLFLVLSMVLIVFPISVSVFVLYILKDYKIIAVKALYMKSILLVIVYMMFAFDLIMLFTVAGKCISVLVTCKAIEYYDFSFNNANLMKLGILSAILTILPSFLFSDIIIKVVSNNRLSFIATVYKVPIFFLYMQLFLLISFGFMYVVSFNAFREYMDSLREKIRIVMM